MDEANLRGCLAWLTDICNRVGVYNNIEMMLSVYVHMKPTEVSPSKSRGSPRLSKRDLAQSFGKP